MSFLSFTRDLHALEEDMQDVVFTLQENLLLSMAMIVDKIKFSCQKFFYQHLIDR